MIPINSYVIKKSIEHYGKEVQSTVCMEECAELIQAISKEKRGKSDKDHLAEEMADVIICIEMLKQIYNITEDEIYSWIINKQERTIKRIKKDVQSTVCMEECAELIQAISKEKRGKSDKDHLAEEMADVIICIEMLKQIYNITEDEIYSWVITKQERTIERIKRDVQSTETNADRIRNMSDDELAEFLAYNAYCEECYVKKDDSCCYPDGTCKQKHLEWLQSEAE